MNWILLLFVFVGSQGGMAQSSSSFETKVACEAAIIRAKAELEGISRHGTIMVYGTCNHVRDAHNWEGPSVPVPHSDSFHPIPRALRDGR